ncbi:MAG TPA: hypothetical protein VF516_06345 [Kofleriaceae bacterium]
MRRVAGVGWLLLMGCNRIFGIAATQPWDAGPDVTIDMPHVVLTWQLATTSPSGAPSPQLEYPPFAAGVAPQIRIATLDGPFMPPLASYSSDAATPGWILVPRSYFEPSGSPPAIRPWRLEYTLPGGIPHEVQWAPDDKTSHLVVPMVGRLDRVAVPAGSGYTVTWTSSFTFTGMDTPRVLTTGLWTTGLTGMPLAGAKMVDYDFGNATSLSGPKGSPDPAQGDRGLVVDYLPDPDNKGFQCNVAVASTPLTQLALSGTGHTAETAVWDTARPKVNSDLPLLPIEGRLTNALGPLNTVVSRLDSQLAFGVVPSTSFPGLIGSSKDFKLPVPVMQTLLQCPVGPNAPGPMDMASIPGTARPTQLGDFPTAVHVQLVDGRPVPPLTDPLFSGMETVITASAGGGFQLSFPAAIPTGILLTTPAGGKVDLINSPEHVAVGAPTGAFLLDITPETGVGLRADYYDVYLRRITGTALTVERIYTVTAPEVRIDGARLAPGADYVFEIRSYAGHVMAPRGDFAPVDYPYGSAVVFTRTFKTS